jgi:anaerobic selenocysteine-containing dehydrogenase
MAEFYTSGRASNEAAFLYQLFARAYGTNNFPDCSNMCHEATGVGLHGVDRRRQGHGDCWRTSTTADAIIVYRPEPRNEPPAHARRHCARRPDARRARSPSMNPLRERGLERFSDRLRTRSRC